MYAHKKNKNNLLYFSYKLETLRTFLIQDSNYYGLAILHRIEEYLEPFMDLMQQENMSIAIMFLLVNKQDIFFNMKDDRIKQIYGECPFKVLQDLYKVKEYILLKMLIFTYNNCVRHAKFTFI